MVVTRKASANQHVPPPASRTNSSTSTPRIKAKKIPASTSSLDSPTTSNGAQLPPAPGVAVAVGKKDSQGPFADPPKVIGSSPLKQSISKASLSASPSRNTGKGGKRKGSKAPKPASSRVMKTVRRVVLAGLIGHTLLVCPYDNDLESPVCSTLHDFRGYFNYHIFEPHLKPQASKIASHPSVAPIIDPVLQYGAPVVGRVTPVVKDVSLRLSKAYLSYLDKAHEELSKQADPHLRALHQQYSVHVQPFLDKNVLPPYQQYVAPGLIHLEHYGRVAGLHAEPYLYKGMLAVQDLGRQVQPHALVALGYLAEVPRIARQIAWEPLMDLRRTYVDPPISKILETVDEVGSEAKATASRFETAFMARAEQTPGDAPAPDMPVYEEDVDSIGTSASEPYISTPTNQPTTILPSDAGPITAEGPQETVSDATPVDSDTVEDEDLEAFLRDLGTEPDLPADPAPEETPSEPQQTDTPEEAAERLRLKELETAEKRADILGRHENWERQVQALTDKHVAALPGILHKLRAESIAALDAANHPETMQKDADKALKNTEAFVKKLVSDSGSEEQKVALLDNVVSKVQKRFEDGAGVLSNNIVTWWEGVRRVESEEFNAPALQIEKLVNEVRDLGATAQADLGLDYAWLDDVTVKDWARYHGLLNAAKELETRMESMAFGNTEEALENALAFKLRDLQVDLETVVLRFQTRLSEAHARGLEAVKGRTTPPADAQGNKTPSQETATSIGADEPTFSILPIDDDLGRNVQDDDSAEYIFIEKGKEQVEDAARQAQEAANDQSSDPTLHVEL
ncbi:hypothetical protein FS837_005501 [Tulasnella sp. UAMH 9824]|nr:hypothetical protein FS837_005501 [Tulasnella sp. UAMH 9824]